MKTQCRGSFQSFLASAGARAVMSFWLAASVLIAWPRCAASRTSLDANATMLIAKGRYLATAADCVACHTAPKSGRPFAGGYGISSPLGIIYSANITPSKTAGIGRYTEAQFAKAIRQGIDADGKYLYPAMPYTSYALLSDEDVKALYAYFMHGVAPIDIKVPKTKLPFPFDIRVSMIGWDALFLDEHRFVADPEADQQINRGNYLVNALGHCDACHTPRNFLMAEEQGKAFGGAQVGNWYAPNITADPVSGIGAWSDTEIMQYLATGHAIGKNQAAGKMAEVVQDSLQYLSKKDLEAIVAYLRTVAPIRDKQDVKPAYTYGQPISVENTMRGAHGRNERGSLRSGAALFSGYCASCHQANGAGSDDQSFPSLYHNTATGGGNAGAATNLVSTILLGVDRTVHGQRVLMPRFDSKSYVNPLTNKQIALIANYVLAQYGNPTLRVTPRQVAQARQGGPKTLLAKMQPYIAPVGIALIVILLIAISWIVIACRRRHRLARNK